MHIKFLFCFMEDDSKREHFCLHCHVTMVLWVICLAGRKHKYLSALPGLASWMEKMLGKEEESKSVWIYCFYFYALAWNLVLNSRQQ